MKITPPLPSLFIHQLISNELMNQNDCYFDCYLNRSDDFSSFKFDDWNDEIQITIIKFVSNIHDTE